jgi:hypothetical protein
MVHYFLFTYYFKKHMKPCIFILKALKDILQHFKFVNWRISELLFSFFDVTNRLIKNIGFRNMQKNLKNIYLRRISWKTVSGIDFSFWFTVNSITVAWCVCKNFFLTSFTTTPTTNKCWGFPSCIVNNQVIWYIDRRSFYKNELYTL